MALGNPINIRLSVEKQLLYEAEAAGRRVPLATYLRERLEEEDALLEELSALRRTMERVALETASSEKGNEIGILLEMLLLLRQLAQGQKTQVAQQTLKHLGYDIWEGQ